MDRFCILCAGWTGRKYREIFRKIGKNIDNGRNIGDIFESYRNFYRPISSPKIFNISILASESQWSTWPNRCAAGRVTQKAPLQNLAPWIWTQAQLPAYQRFNVDRVAKDLKGNPFSTLLVRENKRKIENNRRVGEKLPNE